MKGYLLTFSMDTWTGGEITGCSIPRLRVNGKEIRFFGREFLQITMSTVLEC